MGSALRRKYIRLIYAKVFRYLGIVLVLCALIGGIARSRMYFVFALCAAGGVMVAWGWFTYLKATGLKAPGFGQLPSEKKKVPYFLRKNKDTVRKPAFMMNSEDFDDDLNDATSLSDGDFNEVQIRKMLVWSRIVCGLLLFLISFIIKY